MVRNKCIASAVVAVLSGPMARTAGAQTFSRASAPAARLIPGIGAGLDSPVPAHFPLGAPRLVASVPSSVAVSVASARAFALAPAASLPAPSALAAAFLPAAGKDEPSAPKNPLGAAPGEARPGDPFDRLLRAQDDPAEVFDGAPSRPFPARDLRETVSSLLLHLSEFVGEPGPLLALEEHPLPVFVDAARALLAERSADSLELAALAKALRELRAVALLPDDSFPRRRMRATADGRTLDLLEGSLGRDGALIELHLALLRHPMLGGNALATMSTGLDQDLKAEAGRRALDPEAARELLAAFESAHFRVPVDGYAFASGFLRALKLSGGAEPRRIIELAVLYLRHAAARGEHADMADALRIFVFQSDGRYYTPEIIIALGDSALRRAPTLAEHVTRSRFETLATWAGRFVDAGPARDRLLDRLAEQRGLALSLAPKPKAG